MQKTFQSHRLRNGRASLIGYAYHLRFGLQDRQQHFSNFEIAHAVVRAIAREADTGRTQNLCFCVMPDHVHWLLVLQKGTLGRSVHNIKRLSQHLSQADIPWQRGFFDHGIRDPQNLRNTARYIVANPLRADLVTSVSEYSHWDAIWLGDTHPNAQALNP